MFDPNLVDLPVLRERAYNLRWATVPQDVIPLTAADPDFPFPPPVLEAIQRFSAARYFSYTPAEGWPEFRASMAEFFTHKRNWPASPADILPVDSAAFGIYLTCKAFLSTGDEAIIFDPVDFLFRYSVEAAGARAIAFPIPADTGVVDFQLLESLLTSRTKLICLCNPLNPTGKVFTAAELATLGALALKHNLLILSDEIWSDIVFAPHSFTSIASLDPAIRQSTITITGFSKSYGLAGLRIGAVAATHPPHWQRIFEASLHASTVHGVNILSQVAASAALRECGEWLDGFVCHLHAMRRLCVDSLNAIPGISCKLPQGCYVAFADIRGTGLSSAEMRDILFHRAKVAVVPGLAQWFGPGAEGYIRLSFATSEKILQDALGRIQSTIRTL
ncbi:MAG TPA: pyridoxal phosphate-dependent aminotransferase [Puia sp.]|jgi:aminotransferase|nr:pyridoxal phosphate-dependent aminotransferase [Puia sp.]